MDTRDIISIRRRGKALIAVALMAGGAMASGDTTATRVVAEEQAQQSLSGISSTLDG